jgi:Arc/MetJ-type ribon-helix-helix transcriptional regulator
MARQRRIQVVLPGTLSKWVKKSASNGGAYSTQTEVICSALRLLKAGEEKLERERMIAQERRETRERIPRAVLPRSKDRPTKNGDRAKS